LLIAVPFLLIPIQTNGQTADPPSIQFDQLSKGRRITEIYKDTAGKPATQIHTYKGTVQGSDKEYDEQWYQTFLLPSGKGYVLRKDENFYEVQS